MYIDYYFTKKQNEKKTMGYTGKLIVEHTGIVLPKSFMAKYEKDYHIHKKSGGEGYLNISSKYGEKGHFEIIYDLEELLKDWKFDVWAAILWEDGVIDRHNLMTGKSEKLGNGDFEN